MRLANLVLVVMFSLSLSTLVLKDDVQAQEAALQLCLAAASDYSPIYPTRTFPSTTTELIAVFQLGDGESYKTLTSTWIAVDVGDAAPQNYQIATGKLSLKGQKIGRFRYSQPKPLPTGKYRLDVTADGKPWQSAEFKVVPAGKGLALQNPQDLLPLTKGQIWKYRFVQEAGKGAKITTPGITLNADGKLRATVTLTVAGIDQAGAHIELRRNDVLVFEEWWQLGQKGLAATKRKKDNKVTVLDPPQILLPWPLESPRTWHYEPRDKSFKQRYQMWGPLPVKGPNGKVPGYVIVVQQPPQSPRVTVERHFMPGVGILNEVIIQAIGGKMLSRQEMVLEESGGL